MERRALAALAEILAELGIDWVLIGALAANRYRASARLTQDIDLLLADAGRGFDALRVAFEHAGWSTRWASPEEDMLRVAHPEHGLADLMVAATDYQREAIARSLRGPLPDIPAARVLAPEDVIVHKLIAGRMQDLADIEAILETRPDLDRDHIERWARFWEVLQAWRDLDS